MATPKGISEPRSAWDGNGSIENDESFVVIFADISEEGKNSLPRKTLGNYWVFYGAVIGRLGSNSGASNLANPSKGRYSSDS